MRLSLIWDPTFPMAMKERLRRTRDWAALDFARLLPKRVRFWCAISEIGKATMKSPNIPATTVDYVLKHLDAPEDLS